MDPLEENQEAQASCLEGRKNPYPPTAIRQQILDLNPHPPGFKTKILTTTVHNVQPFLSEAGLSLFQAKLAPAEFLIVACGISA